MHLPCLTCNSCAKALFRQTDPVLLILREQAESELKPLINRTTHIVGSASQSAITRQEMYDLLMYAAGKPMVSKALGFACFLVAELQTQG